MIRALFRPHLPRWMCHPPAAATWPAKLCLVRTEQALRQRVMDWLHPDGTSPAPNAPAASPDSQHATAASGYLTPKRGPPDVLAKLAAINRRPPRSSTFDACHRPRHRSQAAGRTLAGCALIASIGPAQRSSRLTTTLTDLQTGAPWLHRRRPAMADVIRHHCSQAVPKRLRLALYHTVP